MDFRTFVGTWNVGGNSPPEDLNLRDWLQIPASAADIYVLGFQEIVPLNAGNVLGPEDSSTAAKWLLLIRQVLNSSREDQDVCYINEVAQQMSNSCSKSSCERSQKILLGSEKEGDEVRRNSDVIEILKKTRFSHSLKLLGRQFSPDHILEHDNIIWLGDLNYRLVIGRGDTCELLKKNDWQALLEKDQVRF
ncbi:DNAse I-like superfamily protein [Actinidia rufa]|uniref:DNAse I-like superfamily protein n=1 Tax=Actinidia rufa TaxID=165716 RepID=A0A7J0H4F3_9ERIC|nr:DNAse I-like superfamily protein [Actinidia rufa]